MYSNCGQLAIARKLFDTILERSVVAWNAVISGYEQNGLAEQAIEVYKDMHMAGEVPDSTLSACAHRLVLWTWGVKGRDALFLKGWT